MEAPLAVPQTAQLEVFCKGMEQGGREDQAEDIRQILFCVRSMKTDFEEAMEEISYLREYIQSLEDTSLKTKLGTIQEEIQQSFCDAGGHLKEVEKDIMGKINKGMDVLKSKKIQALDWMLDTACVSQGLGKVETTLMQAAAGMARKIEAIDRMAEEFHAIKGHAKNIGRTVTGRPTEEIAARDVTKGILAKLRAGMEYCRKILAGMGQKVLMARAHVEHLNQMADPKIEQASSIQQIAGELRAAAAMDASRQPGPIQSR